MNKEIDELKLKAVTAMTGSDFDRAMQRVQTERPKVNEKMDEECYFLSEDAEQFYYILMAHLIKGIHSCKLQNTFKQPTNKMICLVSGGYDIMK